MQTTGNSEPSIIKKVLEVFQAHQASGTPLRSGDFGLPSAGKFADGALDGIMYYHLGTPEGELPEEAAKGLQLASDGDIAGAGKVLEAYFDNSESIHTTLEIADAVSRTIQEKQQELDFHNLYKLAVSLLMYSGNVECVKFALLLLEFTDMGTKEVHDMVRILSTCGEFTLFCCFSMCYWEDRAAALADAAQINQGWGRIFAIQFMNREDLKSNPILARWLLFEGCKNDVAPVYSAAKIAELIDLPLLLTDSAMTAEDFRACRDLIAVLLEEEPMAGLSSFEGSVQADILHGFLLQIGRISPEEAEYRLLNRLYEYVQDNPSGMEEETAEGIALRIRRLMDTEEGKRAVRRMLGEKEAFALAGDMGIDCTEQIYNALKLDFVGFSRYAARLYNRESSRRMVLKLACDKLPVEAMKEKKADEEMSLEEMMVFFCLKDLLKELGDYPGSGEELVLHALDMEAADCRAAALALVEDWKENGYRVSAAIEAKL
ncbi:MAG: hypothetical protein Q4B22_10425 [Eubacteriales bacterium]|nr:hypothetical protein [Eubacteriales bacterium]